MIDDEYDEYQNYLEFQNKNKNLLIIFHNYFNEKSIILDKSKEICKTITELYKSHDTDNLVIAIEILKSLKDE